MQGRKITPRKIDTAVGLIYRAKTVAVCGAARDTWARWWRKSTCGYYSRTFGIGGSIDCDTRWLRERGFSKSTAG